MLRTNMSRRMALKSSALGLAGWAAACQTAGDSEPSGGDFKPLFNGADLTGWEGDPFLWVVEDGMLIGRSPGIGYNDFLVATGSYSNFVLKLSVHLLRNEGNSGIQFRSERIPGSMEMIGYQADIGPGWWGSLYDESRRRRMLAEADPAVIERILEPDGWNEYEIRAEGPRVQLRLNGELTVDYEETEPDIPLSGRIAVQIHSGPPLEVRFRDIRIREL